MPGDSAEPRGGDGRIRPSPHLFISRIYFELSHTWTCTSHYPRAAFLLFFIFCVELLYAVTAYTLASPAPQQPAVPVNEVETGRQLYQRGDSKGAIKVLRSAVKKQKDNHTAWLYLGHAYLNQGNLKEAGKSFEHSLQLRPDFVAARAGLAYFYLMTGNRQNAEREAAAALKVDNTLADAHYVIGLVRLDEGAWMKVIEEADAIIKIDPKAAAAYSLKSQAALGLYNKAAAVLADERRGAYPYNAETIKEAREFQAARLKEAAANLEKYIQLNPKARDSETYREQIETLRVYAETNAAEGAQRIYNGSELTTKAVIVKKPDPGFTEDARRAGTSGVVRLRVVLAADGLVKHILVIKSLRNGLTERAIKAARAIKFKPATVNNVPVSQFVTLEYNFNIY